MSRRLGPQNQDGWGGRPRFDSRRPPSLVRSILHSVVRASTVEALWTRWVQECMTEEVLPGMHRTISSKKKLKIDQLSISNHHGVNSLKSLTYVSCK
jgi:hypothetical protein